MFHTRVTNSEKRRLICEWRQAGKGIRSDGVNGRGCAPKGCTPEKINGVSPVADQGKVRLMSDCGLFGLKPHPSTVPIFPYSNWVTGSARIRSIQGQGKIR